MTYPIVWSGVPMNEDLGRTLEPDPEPETMDEQLGRVLMTGTGVQMNEDLGRATT